MRAIILAGGKGTRLRPYTTILPKPLMPVGDAPILEIILCQLKHFGFTEITIAVGHLAQLIEAYFGNGSKLGVQISYSLEDKPLGTAGPMRLIGDLGESFLLMNGDILTTLDFGKMYSWHRARGGIATLGVFQKKVPLDLGVLKVSDGDYVEGYTEKPTLSYSVSMGIYIFEPRVQGFMAKDVRLDLPELVLELIGRGEQVGAYRFEGMWLDIGRPDDYQEAVTAFEEHRPEFLPGE